MGKIYASLESATPANPAAGKSVIYPKSGGWYYRNETGAEVQWLDTTSLPNVANTYLRRNAGNTAFDAKTPQQVADELSPLQKFGPRNYIIGGDFSTNPWQRGTSFAGVTSTIYFADRFFLEISSSGTWTLAKIADAPTFAQAGRSITHCMEMLCTAADGAVAAGDFAMVVSKVEGYNYLPLYQKPQLIGFWAKANLTGDYGVSIRNGGFDRSYVSKITINAANTWEYKTISVPTAPVGGTWDFVNGIGLAMSVALVCGSTFQTATFDAWQSGNLIAPNTQVNLANTVNNYFRIADVKLIEGIVDVTTYQPSAQEALSACQRYYATGMAAARFPATSASQYMNTAVYYPVTMRAAPTLSLVPGTRSNLSSVIIAGMNATSARFEIVSLAAGDTYALNEIYMADAEL